MSVDLDPPAEAATSDQPITRTGKAASIGGVVIPLVCLLVGAAIGSAATLGAVALAQKPKSTLSGAAAAIPTLAQPQRHADTIPTGLPGFDSNLIVAGSSRLAGQTSAASYYLSVSKDGQACLLILPSDTSKPWAQGCAERLPLGVAAAGSGSARLISSNSATPAGTIRMGLNVVVDPTSTSLIK